MRSRCTVDAGRDRAGWLAQVGRGGKGSRVTMWWCQGLAECGGRRCLAESLNSGQLGGGGAKF